ncbi:MAG TPA: Sir2 family NAD-dependent protein deacetylase [Streptosporangiaceae bacterium]|nr:Sir2 family NAD-dependent protein deacetylase [Streptosporangiaceae bacterium]
MTQDDLTDTEPTPDWAKGVRAVTALTGAGISTDSGIPDFRGRKSSVYATLPTPSFHEYISDPGVRRQSWQRRRDHPAWRAEPNPAHHALTELARSDIDTWVISQNIDGLHAKSGTPPDRLLELHGNMFGAMCVSCGDRTAMTDALARVEAGDEDPACRRCGGILKSTTVMFGENLHPETFQRAVQVAGDCDLFLAIGSTLVVEPAASLCGIAAHVGAALVIVNRDPTPYDHMAKAVIHEPIGIAVPRLITQIIQANKRH